jgi:hypothetical protein
MTPSRHADKLDSGICVRGDHQARRCIGPLAQQSALLRGVIDGQDFDYVVAD